MSPLLENGPIVPSVLIKLSRGLGSINWMLSIWALMSIILVNAYKGIVTSELTSNPPLKEKFTRIDEIDGFILVVPGDFWAEMSASSGGEILESSQHYNVIDISNLKTCLCYPQVSEIINRICRRRNNTCAEGTAKLSSLPFAVRKVPTPQFCAYKNYLGQPVTYDAKHQFPLRPYSQGLYCPRMHAVYPTKDDRPTSSLPLFKNIFMSVGPYGYAEFPRSMAYFESVINTTSDCHGIGYIDYELETDLFIQTALHITESANYKKGKEKLFQRLNGIVLFPIDDTYILACYQKHKKMLDIMAHGIFQIWEKWFKRYQPIANDLKYLANKQVNRAKGIKMDSNVNTAFTIYFICAFICTCIFYTETYSVIYLYMKLKISVVKQKIIVKFTSFKKNSKTTIAALF